MNNRGQTLILFVLILPIVFVILALIINYASLSVEKRKLSNNIKYAVEYGMNLKLENEVVEDSILTNEMIKNKLEYLINQNISYDDLKIIVSENSISITAIKDINGFMNFVFNDKFEVSYYGTFDNKKIVIEER